MAVEYEFDLEKRFREELASTVQIRIFSYHDRIAGGVVKSMLDKRETPFYGLDQAVLIIEELLDRHKKAGLDYRYIDPGVSYKSWLDNHIWPQIRGCPQNFLIRVYGREKRSLQGELKAGEKRCYFRSGMELIRLIHQCLQIKYETPPERGRCLSTETQKICNIRRGRRE